MSGRTPKFFGSISPCLLDSMELSGSACVATVYGGAGPLLDTKWVGLRGRMLEGHFYNRSLDWIFFFSNISGDIFEWGYSKSGSGRTFLTSLTSLGIFLQSCLDWIIDQSMVEV